MSDFLALNWGYIASVLGLGVSVWVLVVAQKARAAAEEARTLARLRGIAEEVGEASGKILQLGTFLRDQKCDMAQFRVQEIMGSCSLVLARWGDQLVEDCRNDLLKASNITKSIAIAVARSSVRELTEAERLRTLNAQVKATELINSVLGEARKTKERRHGKP